jgi:hypothetical protein
MGSSESSSYLHVASPAAAERRQRLRNIVDHKAAANDNVRVERQARSAANAFVICSICNRIVEPLAHAPARAVRAVFGACASTRPCAASAPHRTAAFARVASTRMIRHE